MTGDRFVSMLVLEVRKALLPSVGWRVKYVPITLRKTLHRVNLVLMLVKNQDH